MVWKSVLAIVASGALTAGVMAESAQPGATGQQNQQGQSIKQQDQGQSGQWGQSGQTGQTGQYQQGGVMGGSEMSDASSKDPDMAFAAVLVSHARLERQISELVAQKATDPQVKKLAQEVSEEQQRFSQRIQQAAQKEGLTLHPDRMLPRDQAVLSYLQQLPVNSLERNYVFFQAGSTQTNMLLSRWAAKNAQKPEIKQVAQDIANRLDQRIQTIQQLAQAEINNPANNGATAGER